MSKLSRGDKGEILVSNKLNKLKEYHRLINDVTFINKNSEMSHQIDHILIHPYGIFVIETKNYYGEIAGEKDDVYWTKIVNHKYEKIHNPLKQNKSHVVMVNRILKSKYDVIPLVIFVKNNVPYMGDENVINLNDLELFISSYPYKRILSKDNIDEIYNILIKNKVDISKDEHVENISFLKQVKKELCDEKRYAIEKGICPRCDSKLNIRGNKFRCPNCEFKFEL